MKFVICVVFLLTVIVNLSSAAVARGVYKDPNHPGKCAIRKNLILSAGEKIKNPDVDCGQILCSGDGDVQFHTCGVQVFHNCILGDYLDKSLPYPDCCRREKICQ